MAMTSGGGGGAMGDINVTPMIDILLVLLIIFMVIVPVTPKGLDALVPQPPKNPQQQQNDQIAIVVQVLANKGGEPSYKINETPFAKSELQQKLTDIFATRAERVMFVRGDDNVDFHYIAEVIDIGYAANVQHVGLMTPQILAGH
jgi:biopolymer transport protein TolR